MPSSEAVLARLTANMESLTPVINALREDVKSGNDKTVEMLVEVQGLKTAISEVKDDVEKLTQVVSTGNGQPSLIQRVTTIETTFVSVVKDVSDLKTKYDTVATAKMLTRGQIIAGVIGMVVTAVLSLGAILSQLAK